MDFEIDEFLVPALNYSRMLLFAIEGMPIKVFRRLVGLDARPNPGPPSKHLQYMLISIHQMVQEDAANVAAGIYSKSLLLPEDPRRHLRRYRNLLKDSVRSTIRARFRKHDSFSDDAAAHLKNVPDYYKRNFHFQTDGYLSEESADLYGHQTEILFLGTIQLMRRLLLAPLIKEIRAQSGMVRVFEMGAGGGDTTEILLRSCPNVEIVAVDLSEPYLKKAKERLKDFSNVKFITGDAVGKLSLKEKFDVVLSAFVLHELPLEERRKFLAMPKKMLKPGGTFMFMDSLQMGDNKHFDWALVHFPKYFHEPFYTNYVQTPLRNILRDCGLDKFNQRMVFLSKAILGKI